MTPWLILVPAVAATALLAVAVRFAYAHRSYPRELATVVEHLRGDGPTCNITGRYASLEVYPVLFDSSAQRTEVSEEDDSLLGQAWTPPLRAGRRDHPVAIALDGLSNHARWLTTTDERFLQHAEAAAHELASLQQADGSWRYEFDHADLLCGWASAMAQGQGISLLLRIHTRRPHDGYEPRCRSAMAFMLRPSSDGGTIGTLPDGSPIPEEYPGSKRMPNVLNGSIFALFGLYDFALHFGDDAAMSRFLSMASHLAANLDRYDTGVWTTKHLGAGVGEANSFYHRLHVEQARAMHLLTMDDRWAIAESRWSGYLDERRRRMTLPRIWWQDTRRRADIVKRKRLARHG